MSRGRLAVRETLRSYGGRASRSTFEFSRLSTADILETGLGRAGAQSAANRADRDSSSRLCRVISKAFPTHGSVRLEPFPGSKPPAQSLPHAAAPLVRFRNFMTLDGTWHWLREAGQTRLTYRYSGRDFRLTDVAGNVVKEILA